MFMHLMDIYHPLHPLRQGHFNFSIPFLPFEHSPHAGTSVCDITLTFYLNEIYFAGHTYIVYLTCIYWLGSDRHSY